MGPANALSWKDDINTNDDNYMVTLLLKDDICHHQIWQLDLDLTQKISRSSTTDLIVTKALSAIIDKNGDPWLPCTTKEDWKFNDGSLYFKNHLYNPENA